MIVTLTPSSGSSQGAPRLIELAKPSVTVGRSKESDLVIDETTVSKLHCRIFQSDGALVVEDMRSTNGTYVNGKRIDAPTAISSTDRIYIGSYKLTAQIGTEPPRVQNLDHSQLEMVPSPLPTNANATIGPESRPESVHRDNSRYESSAASPEHGRPQDVRPRADEKRVPLGARATNGRTDLPSPGSYSLDSVKEVPKVPQASLTTLECSTAPPTCVTAAASLVEALASLLRSAPLQRLPRQRILQAHAQATEILRDLSDVHENLVSLHELPVVRREPSSANRIWQNLSPGVVDDESLEPVRAASPTLTNLYRSGFNLRRATRFSDIEIELATSLAESFENHWLALDRFKLSINHKQSHFEFVKKEFDTVRRFLNLLRRRGVIAGYDFQLWQFADQTAYPIPEREIPRIARADQPLFACFRLANERLADLIGGRWLAAFAYRVIEDHLVRYDAVHEIFSELSFQPAPGVLSIAGDFDVLVGTEKAVLAVECKSGRLKEGGERRDIHDIVSKADRLKAALVKAGASVDNFHFWLVYNPHCNESELPSRFEGSGIQAMAPLDIRRCVSNLFRDPSA